MHPHEPTTSTPQACRTRDGSAATSHTFLREHVRYGQALLAVLTELKPGRCRHLLPGLRRSQGSAPIGQPDPRARNSGNSEGPKPSPTGDRQVRMAHTLSNPGRLPRLSKDRSGDSLLGNPRTCVSEALARNPQTPAASLHRPSPINTSRTLIKQVPRAVVHRQAVNLRFSL